MGFQFAHIYSYSMDGGKEGKFKVAGCLGEAFRDEEYTSHIEKPAPPEILFGNRESFEKAIGNYLENHRDKRGHKCRKDARLSIGGVYSFPAGMSDEDREKGEKLVLDWLKQEYGESLRYVIKHTDEPFLRENKGEIHHHIHWGVVPEPGQLIRDLHPGLKAKWEAEHKKLAKDEEPPKLNLAYKWAMGDWQDRVNQAVSFPLGILREGPKRKRISQESQRILNESEKKADKKLDDARLKSAAMTAEAGELMESAKEQKKELAEKNTQLLAKENQLSARDLALAEVMKTATLPQKISTITIETLRNSQINTEETKRFWPAFFKELPNFCKFILDKVRQNIQAEKPQIQKKQQEQGRGR